MLFHEILLFFFWCFTYISLSANIFTTLTWFLIAIMQLSVIIDIAGNEQYNLQPRLFGKVYGFLDISTAVLIIIVVWYMRLSTDPPRVFCFCFQYDPFIKECCLVCEAYTFFCIISYVSLSFYLTEAFTASMSFKKGLSYAFQFSVILSDAS